jgi:type I restriction enzyme M protein
MAERKSRSDRYGDAATGADVRCQTERWKVEDALLDSVLESIAEAFEKHHTPLVAERATGADPGDADQYRTQSIFWVPPETRWARLNAQTRRPTTGRPDDALSGIGRDNPALKSQIAREDTFNNGRHPGPKADFILTNPPFNTSDRCGERLRGDARGQYGIPPGGNANAARGSAG